ncbi:MAG: hypothetical protein Fur0014_10630 [Rubrivivax sp.]
MKHESTVVSYSNQASLEARSEIFKLMQEYPATPEEKERSLGLFLRGSLLARLLAIAEIYQRIVHLPGAVLDIGTWRGQTAVVCENLRAIYEPLHFNRRIYAFDTFEGYQGFSADDKATELHQNGTYGVGGESYAELLRTLLGLHERSNAMGDKNHGKHRVIMGDCVQTVRRMLDQESHEVIALAFFDVNSVHPTEKTFEMIWDRVVQGGVVAFWQLTRNTIPAEGMVYARSIMGRHPHSLHRCATYPGLCYLVKS